MKNLRWSVLVLSVFALAAGLFLSPVAMDAAPCPNGPDYKYVSRDYEECLTLQWFCEPGTEQFLVEDCGCGCVVTQ